MKTSHKIFASSSTDLEGIDQNSIQLVVTSPPYPMIEMWDEIFSNFDQDILCYLNKKNGKKAFSQMHHYLNKIWKEVDRVLTDGGIVCINIGDATRKIGDSFELYPNHTMISQYFQEMGYSVLPSIIWRKQTNKPNKFMGSGMLPPNAYVTLEHEYILIFRKGSIRKFNSEDIILRRKSAYFWEERNKWFSDIWFDLKGTSQKLNQKELRKRSAAFPFELAYRLINMYSIMGDTVLDPFCGTGTTTLAAIYSGRNSIGYEIDEQMCNYFPERLSNIKQLQNNLIDERIKHHIEFINEREMSNKFCKHESNNYSFPIVTMQEKNIIFPRIQTIEQKNGNYEILYTFKNKQTTLVTT